MACLNVNSELHNHISNNFIIDMLTRTCSIHIFISVNSMLNMIFSVHAGCINDVKG